MTGVRTLVGVVCVVAAIVRAEAGGSAWTPAPHNSVFVYGAISWAGGRRCSSDGERELRVREASTEDVATAADAYHVSAERDDVRVVVGAGNTWSYDVLVDSSTGQQLYAGVLRWKSVDVRTPRRVPGSPDVDTDGDPVLPVTVVCGAAHDWVASRTFHVRSSALARPDAQVRLDVVLQCTLAGGGEVQGGDGGGGGANARSLTRGRGGWEEAQGGGAPPSDCDMCYPLLPSGLFLPRPACAVGGRGGRSGGGGPGLAAAHVLRCPVGGNGTEWERCGCPRPGVTAVVAHAAQLLLSRVARPVAGAVWGWAGRGGGEAACLVLAGVALLALAAAVRWGAGPLPSRPAETAPLPDSHRTTPTPLHSSSSSSSKRGGAHGGASVHPLPLLVGRNVNGSVGGASLLTPTLYRPKPVQGGGAGVDSGSAHTDWATLGTAVDSGKGGRSGEASEQRRSPADPPHPIHALTHPLPSAVYKVLLHPTAWGRGAAAGSATPPGGWPARVQALWGGGGGERGTTPVTLVGGVTAPDTTAPPLLQRVKAYVSLRLHPPSSGTGEGGDAGGGTHQVEAGLVRAVDAGAVARGAGVPPFAAALGLHPVALAVRRYAV